MDKQRGMSVPQQIQCLARHKFKARVIRQNIFLNNMSEKDQQLAKKVVKYQTFLSQKMLHKIKQNELKVFEKQIKEYCKKHKSFEHIKSETSERQINISQYLESIKEKAKVNLQKKKSKATSPQQGSFILGFSPKKSFCNRQEQNQEKDKQAMQFKKVLQRKRQQKLFQKQLKLKGTLLKSTILQLIQKSQFLEHTKLLNKDPLFHPLAENPLKDLLPADKLKYQKERLTTVLEHHSSAEFKPIGNVRKNFKTKKLASSSEKKSTNDLPSIKRKNSKQSMTNTNAESVSKNQLLQIQNNIVIKPAKKTAVNLSEPNIMRKYIKQRIDSTS